MTNLLNFTRIVCVETKTGRGGRNIFSLITTLLFLNLHKEYTEKNLMIFHCAGLYAFSSVCYLKIEGTRYSTHLGICVAVTKTLSGSTF